MDKSTFGQVRISRPTNHLQEVRKFYVDGLGMEQLLQFENDPWGYGGVVLAMQGFNVHLEFTTHREKFPEYQTHSPGSDHLLVFFMPDDKIYNELISRMKKHGYTSVRASNPHWDQDGITFEDPDGWRVVLMKKSNI
jgi:catechol 2,3-dioxygenase-like lactoylglutathione lyase family enzyme